MGYIFQYPGGTVTVYFLAGNVPCCRELLKQRTNPPGMSEKVDEG